MPQYSDDTMKELGQILLRARNNPKTAKEAAQLVRKLDPSVKFPDLEIDDLRDEIRQQREEDAMKAEQDAALRRLAMQRRQIAERFNNDPQHLTAIESLMQKHRIADYEVGAKLYAAEQAPPEGRPEPRPTGHWTMPHGKEFWENPLAYEREQAKDAIDEINAARSRQH